MQIENLIRSRILLGNLDGVKDDLSEIVFWKAGPKREPEMLERFSLNDAVFLKNTVLEVVSALRRQPDDVGSALRKLVSLKGVGIPVASAFLRFFDPIQHRYGVIDKHVATYLNRQRTMSFDLSYDGSIKKYPPSSCETNIQEYQKYHNWLQLVSDRLRRRNVTYVDIYGNAQSFAPVDIDMAIFASCTQTDVAETMSSQPKDLEMRPDTQFTNLNQLYQLLETLRGVVQLLDKDIDLQALRFMHRLNPSAVRRLQILGGRSHLSADFKEECKAFISEMNNRGIPTQIRILEDKDSQEIHDRYLISDHVAYNTPPWNVIHKKLGDVKHIPDHWAKRERFDNYWSRATEITRASTK